MSFKILNVCARLPVEAQAFGGPFVSLYFIGEIFAFTVTWAEVL